MSARPPGLARFLAPAPVLRPGERCDMCREMLPDEHSHVVALENRSLLCTCRACYLLFTREGAAQGKYKTVPDRYQYDPGFALSEADWEALQIPVRMAFFFYNSAMERLVAFYPSPAGATESLLPQDGWPELLRLQMEPDVEALLVSRSAKGFECFLVPIDACYELVGRVRRSWKGFDGGQEAWADIDAFFNTLRDRSKQGAWAN